MIQQQNNKADAWLQHQQRYQSGRLTIFLGAAPGIGKTFAMLVRAHDLALQGIHIAIGYVETHGRIETQKLIAGLPIIPRKILEYQSHQQQKKLEEMDLDAILEQKPQIVLVDEFAHSNMPGSRHAKRWQDINELLDAGIDVFTTINIQHLESLNDVVFQITGIRVSETVPDIVFERIRDIRLIDLPVNELLERLNQGKVYLPEQAEQAAKHFFSHANLTALRELSMQTVANYVDTHVRENFAIKGLGPVPLKNHVLVLLNPSVADMHGQAEALVRAGSRIAENRLASWSVVVFSDNSAVTYPEKTLQDGQAVAKQSPQSHEIERALNLARQLGAMTETIYGKQHAKTLYDYVIDRGISTLVLPQHPPKTKLLGMLFRPSFLQQLLKLQPSFELSVVPIRVKEESFAELVKSNQWLTLREIAYVLGTTIFSIMLASLADGFLGVEDLSVIFITAVVFVASKTRMFAAAISAILFFLAYNFFFINPTLTFEISAHKGVVTVVAFLGAALIASRLASRLSEQVTALKAANSYNSVMQNLGQKLSAAVDLNQVIEIAEYSLSKNLNAQIWFHIPEAESIQISIHTINEKEKISADWTFKNRQPSGRFTHTLSKNDWWFIPLLASTECLGVVGLKFPPEQKALNSEQKQLAETMIEYIAQALSRTTLSKALEIANVNSETERLRSALLSSVSHDLRSPLASIIGAADTLSHYRDAMDEQDQNSLLEAIHLEGERLDRYIQNLLDMTRLGHEGLSLKRDWIGIDEIIGSAVRRLERYMPHVLLELHLPEKPLQLFVHAALIEQAIFNVLENAAKFSPEDKAVLVEVTQINNNEVEIAITDQGQGIPVEQREQIFDMFYTMQRGDRGQSGTGLGLTIVKAIIGAHMGQISASSAKNSTGTCIRIWLPIQPAQ